MILSAITLVKCVIALSVVCQLTCNCYIIKPIPITRISKSSSSSSSSSFLSPFTQSTYCRYKSSMYSLNNAFNGNNDNDYRKNRNLLALIKKVHAKQQRKGTTGITSTKNRNKKGVVKKSTKKQSKQVNVEIIIDDTSSSTDKKNKNVATVTNTGSSDNNSGRSRLALPSISINEGVLTKIGYATAAISVLAALLSGDSGSSGRRSGNSRKSKSSSPATGSKSITAVKQIKKSANIDYNDNDDDDDSSSSDFMPPSKLSPRAQKMYQSMKMPASEEMFQDDDEIIADEKPSIPVAVPKVTNTNTDTKPSDAVSNKQVIIEDEIEDEIELPKALPPLPPPPVKKANIFDRIFSKPGGGRSTDINDVISVQDASSSFRVAVAATLNTYIPADMSKRIFASTLPKLQGVYATTSPSDESKTEVLLNARDDDSLTPQETANAFADVTSAMLVGIVDASVAELDRLKGNDDSRDSLIYCLDALGEFVKGAGSIFSKTAAGTSIEPVLYNGKSKKGKLESLYYEYAKFTMSFDDMSSLFAAAANGDADSSGVDDEVMKEKEAKREISMNNLPLIQQVLDIKEGKKNSLDQKVMKEMMMSMSKGGGGDMMGGLGDMMSAFGGGGDGKMPDPKELEEMMKSMGGDSKMPADMSPEQMESMSKDAMQSVKLALEDGSITLADVKELEKIMGVNVKDIVKMMGTNKVDKSKLEALGPDFGEMLSIFQRLAEIK